MDVAAGNVDERALAEHDLAGDAGALRIGHERDGAPGGEELVDVLRHGPGVGGDVHQRRADPARSIGIGAGLPDIEDQRLIEQRAVALQRLVSEFVEVWLDGEEIVGNRACHAVEARDIDHRAGAEQDPGIGPVLERSVGIAQCAHRIGIAQRIRSEGVAERLRRIERLDLVEQRLRIKLGAFPTAAERRARLIGGRVDRCPGCDDQTLEVDRVAAELDLAGDEAADRAQWNGAAILLRQDLRRTSGSERGLELRIEENRAVARHARIRPKSLRLARRNRH